ncbi:MAG TPA: PqqD family protein [Pyrinomonadaceae bacterium]|jgi:Coenzyme PQQ synthesis protein D (PqqD)
MQAKDSNRFKPNPNVLFKRLGDEMVLFNLDTDHFYELNGPAARFWELLSAGHDTAQVSEQMLDEFAVDRDQLASEAGALLASLQQEGLVSSSE